MTRRVAFRLAGLLWLGLGVLLVLTVFGTMLGILMAYLVGIRRSVIAARLGAGLGVLLVVPGQMFLDITGCRRDTCSMEPYLLAYGLPALVIGLNLAAGWPARRDMAQDAQATVASTAPRDGPVQQLLWERPEDLGANLPDPAAGPHREPERGRGDLRTIDPRLRQAHHEDGQRQDGQPRYEAQAQRADPVSGTLTLTG